MSWFQLKKQRLGDLLITEGVLTDEQLQTALGKQKESGGKIGEILIQLGFVSEDVISRALSHQLKMPYIELDRWNFNPTLSQKIPENIARKNKVILLDDFKKQYLLAMSNPTDANAYDEVNRILGKPVLVTVVKESDLDRALDKIYENKGEIASFAKEISEEFSDPNVGVNESEAAAESIPIAKLLDSIFEQAVTAQASDVHIEPGEDFLRIRQRVDGVLQEQVMKGKGVISALVLRIKLISSLDISEKRLPQDGRFQLTIKEQKMDVRVSTMPVRFGESVVMRILDQSKGVLRLSQLGLGEAYLKRLLFLLRRPSGLILVTGPTGSGKTTTLYAGLTELNSKEKKIITIEDPVEYTLPRANQVQINTEIGLTFAGVLRTALRQDPDIVMIGEMRDEETARIGLRAAMTGHMVLSTLHTNDAISTAMRLIDMGAEGFLVASALRAILAQRLVRKNCGHCVGEYKPSEQEVEWLRMLLHKDAKEFKFVKGAGCDHCRKTGYEGRMGVYELLEMNHELGDLLREEDTKGFTQAAKVQPNYIPLAQRAFEYAIEGRTSLEEVIRLAGEAEG